MSDTLEQNEVQENVQFEDLTCFWAENGLPIFMADREDICEIVEGFGFSIYYLLSNNQKSSTTTTTDPKTKVSTTHHNVTKNMQLFKVVNNYVGRIVASSNDPFNESFIKIEEEALYMMPAIPYVMIEKLDQFFRLIDAQHGTESIVMLTYDTTKEGPQGWGIMVPDQTNTPVHCNYDPQSIAEVKEDHIMIVGSVHSHPGMSAYASGTDHADQADFDGIHITFGWQKSVNNGATQYYIEMQMAGKAYKLEPEDVFEGYVIDKAPDPEVVGWSEKVKKVLPPNTGGTHTAQGGRHLNLAPTPQVSTGSGDKPSVEARIDVFTKLRQRFYNVSNISIEKDAIIIAEVSPFGTSKNFYCPVCKVVLDEYDLFKGYCDACFLPVCEINSSISSIIATLAYYCGDLKINTNVPVYVWSIDEHNVECIMKIIEGSLSDEIRKEIETADMFEDYAAGISNNDADASAKIEDENACCNKYVDIGGDCGCYNSLTNSDVFAFDRYIGLVNVYDTTSQCTACENYYMGTCTRYRNIITEWIYNPTTPPESFRDRISDEQCPEYMHYQSNYSSHYSE